MIQVIRLPILGALDRISGKVVIDSWCEGALLPHLSLSTLFQQVYPVFTFREISNQTIDNSLHSLFSACIDLIGLLAELWMKGV